MLKHEEADHLLGDWKDTDFERTIADCLGRGTNADVPDEERFVGNVVRAIRRRSMEIANTNLDEEDDMAIFLLKSDCPDHLAIPRHPMFDNGRQELSGHVWFVSPVVVTARGAKMPDGGDDNRFGFVLDELASGDVDAIIFDPRPSVPELRWYPNGLADADHYVPLRLSGEVSPSAVFETIDTVYKQCFVTPIAGVNLWAVATKYFPKGNAESSIRSHLKAALVIKFPYCDIRQEQVMPSGQSDLEIAEYAYDDRTTVTHHAILELKVLRSYWESGSTVSESVTKDWIRKGVVQADSYRMNRGSKWTALCCFDMRAINQSVAECFAHVIEDARTRDVMLRHWRLFASAAEMREKVS